MNNESKAELEKVLKAYGLECSRHDYLSEEGSKALDEALASIEKIMIRERMEECRIIGLGFERPLVGSQSDAVEDCIESFEKHVKNRIAALQAELGK